MGWVACWVIGDWITLAIQVLDQWHHLLDDDLKIMLPGQWVGLYKDFEANPAFVMQCSTTYTTSCMHHYRFSMSLLPKCFTMGTLSWCLSEWGNPTRDMVGFFHKIEIMHTTRGQKKHEISFFYGKTTTPSWRWVKGWYFLDYTRSSIETWSSTGLEEPLGQWTNDKAISWGTKTSIGDKFGIHSTWARKQP